MVRRTSIEVYHKIVASGLAERLKIRVYNIIDEHGPITAGEIYRFFPGRERSSISARVTELSKERSIKITGERPCGRTGHNAHTWDITNEMPIDRQDKETKDATIARLTEENKQLLKIIGKLQDMIHASKPRDDNDTLDLFGRNYEYV
jgi:hypothetical protein